MIIDIESRHVRCQCLLLDTSGDNSRDKELEPDELDEILSKLKESIQSDIRQAAVWNTLGLILLRTGRLQVHFLIFDISQNYIFLISLPDLKFVVICRALFQFCHPCWLLLPTIMIALETLELLTFKGKCLLYKGFLCIGMLRVTISFVIMDASC